MSAPPIQVLVVDDSGMARSMLSQLIGAQPDMLVVGTAATGHEAVRRATELQPDIVLMDIHMPDLDGIQATWLVSSKCPLGGVIMVTSEERIDFLQKAMTAGAQGYVLKPYGDGVALLGTIRDTYQRLVDRRLRTDLSSNGATTVAAPPRRVGKRVAVFGAKGGVGRTLVAVSLALAMRQLTKESVVLMDADFLFGDADLHLNLTTERSIIDLLPHIEALDSKLVDQVVGKHSSGVHLLSRPPRPEQADAIKDGDMRTLVSSLGMLYEWVVLDTPPSYDDRMLAVLDLADVYVVVLAPHLGALRNTRHFLEIAKQLGYAEDRMCFVLNRANTATDLALNNVASVVGTRRIFQLPSAGAQPTQAINRGRGFLEEQPRSPLAKALHALAEHVRMVASDSLAMQR
ncbi:MAG: response regulator [Chloroflexota bacterium]|nr:response regulator [Chloroflexota bacterium]